MKSDKHKCIVALCNLYSGRSIHKKDYETLKELIENHFSRKKPKMEYAIYDGKSDELLFVGNYHECCSFLNVTKKTFYGALNKTRTKPHLKRRKYKIYNLEEE